ncbi:hypothetical protein VNO80_04901 [Phaseolus coccineus]|uniref:Uncharacterized protein n=1 Tax=Phaseolus coccineus TaxID=3886 RepID=A0AAN9NU99_PHACN
MFYWLLVAFVVNNSSGKISCVQLPRDTSIVFELKEKCLVFTLFLSIVVSLTLFPSLQRFFASTISVVPRNGSASTWQ